MANNSHNLSWHRQSVTDSMCKKKQKKQRRKNDWKYKTINVDKISSSFLIFFFNYKWNSWLGFWSLITANLAPLIQFKTDQWDSGKKGWQQEILLHSLSTVALHCTQGYQAFLNETERDISVAEQNNTFCLWQTGPWPSPAAPLAIIICKNYLIFKELSTNWDSL